MGPPTGACIFFLSLETKVCILYYDKGTFVFKIPMFEKEITARTVWWYKYVKSTITFLFDSLGKLTLVTLVTKAQNRLFFQPFGITQSTNFLLSKAVSHLAIKVFKIL